MVSYPVDQLWNANGGLGSIAAAAAAIGASMMAIGWMAASFLQDERLKAWTKTELLKVGFSIVLVIAALAFFSTGATEKALFELTKFPAYMGDDMWGANHLLVCGSGEARLPPCHVMLGIDYFDTIYKTARNLNRENFVVYSNIAMLVNSNINFRGWIDPWTSSGVNPFIALSIPSDTMGIAFDLIIKTMMVTRFMEFVLDLSSAIIFPTFLLLGIILRMFFFSRKLGGIMVAIALALYLVLPAYFAMMDYVFFKMTGGWDASKVVLANSMDASHGFEGTGTVGEDENARDRFDENGQLREGQEMRLQTEVEGGEEGMLNALERIRHTVLESVGRGIVKSFSLAIFSYDAATGLFGAENENDPLLGFGGMLDNVAVLIVYGIVVPFIGLMLMLASIKVFSPLIGGDVEIAGISRLL